MYRHMHAALMHCNDAHQVISCHVLWWIVYTLTTMFKRCIYYDIHNYVNITAVWRFYW